MKEFLKKNENWFLLITTICFILIMFNFSNKINIILLIIQWGICIPAQGIGLYLLIKENKKYE